MHGWYNSAFLTQKFTYPVAGERHLNMMIDIALIVYGGLVLVAFALYLPKMVGIRYGFRKIKRIPAIDKRKIGIVIPARNEYLVVGELFDSIAKQDYDKRFFDVFVVVKEHDDPTIELASRYGYQVTTIDTQTCKGEALDGFFKTLSEEQFAEFSAFVIVDADGVVAPDYLTELNNALEYPVDIFVTRKLAKNFLKGKVYRSVYSNCAALTWPMLDDMGNAFRTQKGLPLNLCGQGLMVRCGVIRKLGGWPYRTMTEDYELKLDGIILKGFTSAYYPHALLYTEEAIGYRENFSRRVRWLTGYSQCASKYKRQIVKQVKRNKRLSGGEREYFFGISCYAIYLIATICIMLTGVAFAIYYAVVGSNLWLNAFVELSVAPIIALYLLLLVYTLVALYVSRDAFRLITLRERLAMVLYNPLYILEYLGAYIKGRCNILFKKKILWKPTKRVVNKGTKQGEEVS